MVGTTDMLAGAPISWGVCEVPGWGRMLEPDRVFAEMASLGLTATELGPIGYLPFEPAAIRERLDRHGLRLVGGFVPLVLHTEDLRPARESADRIAARPGRRRRRRVRRRRRRGRRLVAPGRARRRRPGAGSRATSARSSAWSPTTASRSRCTRTSARRSRRRDDVERMLAISDAGWCFDSGHLLIGGTDPTDFVRRHGDRIVHAHLKDVDAGIAARLRAGELTLVEATQAGLFRPLGRGDARIDEVVDLLSRAGYERWLVLEQDTAITGVEPPVGRGPVIDVRTSIDYLHSLAPTRRERVAES